MRTVRVTRRGRRGLLAAALAGVAVFAAACSSSGGATGTEPSRAPGQKVALTFWSWTPGIEKSVALWNKQNPDVQVKLDKIPSGGNGGYAKMRAALKAGTAPDVAQVEYQEIPGFLLEKGLVDISKYGANDAQSKFVDWQWKQGSYGGGIYAIPAASGPMGFFYRKDLFAKYGISPPKTWADYAAAAQKLHAADAKAYIGTFPPGNSAWFTALAWQAGAQWFSTEGDTWKVNIDTPTTEKVAAYWDDLRTKGLIKTEPDFANAWYKDLQTGAIAGWVSASWGDAIITGNAPDTSGKWAVAPMPQWNAGESVSANWGGSSIAVLTGSKYPTEATKFSVWLNSDPQSVNLLIEGGYGWPAAKDGVKAPALNQASPFFSGQKYNDIFAKSDQEINNSWGWIPTIDQTYQHLDDSFNAAVSGNGSFVQAVKDAQTKTVADMKAKGLQVATG